MTHDHLPYILFTCIVELDFEIEVYQFEMRPIVLITQNIVYQEKFSIEIMLNSNTENKIEKHGTYVI